MLEFKQSESHAARRRWMFQLIGLDVKDETPNGSKPGTVFTLDYLPDPNSLELYLNGQYQNGGGVDYTLVSQTITMVNTVQSTDTMLATYSVPALTGQTGYGYISKNGTAGVQTTNAMVEIDATNMPGFYYIELTESELNGLGFLGLRVKTSQSLNYEDKALVTYDDPYAFHGGFPIGAGKGDMQKLNWKKLLEMIKQVVNEAIGNIPPVEKIENPDNTEVILKAIKEIPKVDLQPVLNKISAINVKPVVKIPAAKDYTNTLKQIQEAIYSVPKAIVIPPIDFSNLETKIDSLSQISLKLDEMTVEFTKEQEKLQSDLSKHYEHDEEGDNELQKVLKNLNEKIKQALIYLVNLKYDNKLAEIKAINDKYEIKKELIR